MVMLTDDNFTEAVRKAVEIRGEDYIYPKDKPGWTDSMNQCVYSLQDGTPGCLIGLALSLVDPTLVPAFGWHEEGGGSDAHSLLISLNEEGKADLSTPTINAAGWAQNSQDTGETWGKALEAFENNL